MRREIDFTALSHALDGQSDPTANDGAGDARDATTARDLFAEQAVSVSTREAIIHAVTARDGIESAKLASLIVVLASTTIAGILASLIGAWYPLLALDLLTRDASYVPVGTPPST